MLSSYPISSYQLIILRDWAVLISFYINFAAQFTFIHSYAFQDLKVQFFEGLVWQI
jgi:hypothetical protein